MKTIQPYPETTGPSLVDPFGRVIDYLRVSVTDRCDFRCVYCMAENMTFLPKREVLSLEELERLCTAFIDRGVKRIRITGGEPLVRKDIMLFIEALGRQITQGRLSEVTLTTNGSQLHRFAGALHDAGIRRVNVSLDTLDPDQFKAVTRWGDLEKVLAGIEAAKAHGLAVKINIVALNGVNRAELPQMIQWAHDRGMDCTLIETMPLGEIDEDRADQYVPLSEVRADLSKTFTLTQSDYRTGGPARYFDIEETGRRVGFITPLTHNFCESCNRVRITCTGMLYMCLGQDDSADFRSVLRNSDSDEPLHAAIDEALSRKPKGHDFVIDRGRSEPSVTRHMSVTGG